MSSLDALFAGAATNRTVVAEQIGVDRSTLWRRMMKLDKATLEEVAQYLNVSYPQVLVAAMVDSGHIEHVSDLLDGGSKVYCVTRGVGGDVDGPEAVFLDRASAEAYAAAFEEVFLEVPREVVVSPLLAAGTLPPLVEVFNAKWTSRSDRVEVIRRHLHEQLPEAWQGTSRSQLTARVQATTEGVGVIGVEAASTSEATARSLVSAMVQRLRERGQLAPPTMTTDPNGWMDFAETSRYCTSLDVFFDATAQARRGLTAQVAAAVERKKQEAERAAWAVEELQREYEEIIAPALHELTEPIVQTAPADPVSGDGGEQGSPAPATETETETEIEDSEESSAARVEKLKALAAQLAEANVPYTWGGAALAADPSTPPYMWGGGNSDVRFPAYSAMISLAPTAIDVEGFLR